MLSYGRIGESSSRTVKPAWDRVVIVDLDVTDLRFAQKELQEHLDVKKQLVSSVSHELRTPLASIVGFAELLHDSSDLTHEERQEMFELLVQQSPTSRISSTIFSSQPRPTRVNSKSRQ